MFRSALFIVTLASLQIAAFAQSWPGFETGRFAGVSSANLRPGGMAPMPFKADANLFAFHVNTQPKSLFSKDIHRVMFTGGMYEMRGFNELRGKTHMISNLQGPSVQIQANGKVSIAFTWNTRHLWLSKLSEPKTARLFSDEASSLNLNVQDETVDILYTGWDEFGIGAGGVLYDEGFHSFSVGGFFKFVLGTGHMNLSYSDLDVRTVGSTASNIGFDLEGEISDNLYEMVDDGKLNLVGQVGFGFDLGAEYKFLNPRSCPGASNYRLKAGFALTDIGRAGYKSVNSYNETGADINNLDLSDLRNATLEGTTEDMEQIFTMTPTAVTDFKFTLPMSLKLYTEVNIKRRAIIYTEFQFVFAQLVNPNLPVLFRYNLTPRFEDDRFGLYVPLTFTNYLPAEAGLAFRLKPLVIGSGNLFSFWAYDDNRGKALDFYVALKIPILNDDERIDWRTMMRR